jgi:hypothetical protein
MQPLATLDRQSASWKESVGEVTTASWWLYRETREVTVVWSSKRKDLEYTWVMVVSTILLLGWMCHTPLSNDRLISLIMLFFTHLYLVTYACWELLSAHLSPLRICLACILWWISRCSAIT